MNMQTEPVGIIGVIEIAIIAVIGVLAAVMELEPDLVGDMKSAAYAVMAAISALVVAVGTWLQRRNVDSPATVEQKVDEALKTEPPA